LELAEKLNNYLNICGIDKSSQPAPDAPLGAGRKNADTEPHHEHHEVSQKEILAFFLRLT
jgi:hypothetical protein